LQHRYHTVAVGIPVLHQSRKNVSNKLDGNKICTPKEHEVMVEVVVVIKTV